MASATGIPEQPPAAVNRADEYEPLLGRPGDVSQKEDQSLVTNLFTGKRRCKAYLLLKHHPIYGIYSVC